MKTLYPHSWLAHDSVEEDKCQWKGYQQSEAAIGSTQKQKKISRKNVQTNSLNISNKQKQRKRKNER